MTLSQYAPEIEQEELADAVESLFDAYKRKYPGHTTMTDQQIKNFANTGDRDRAF